MPKFRKRPVEVEAFQVPVFDVLDPDGWIEEFRSIAIWCNGGLDPNQPHGTLTIKTLEGAMLAEPGDWIIRGVKGEFYPCKPDIFEQTYKPADQRSALSQLLEVCKATRDLIPREEWPDIEPTWEEWRDAGIRLETAIANYENACEPADQPVTEEVPRIHHFDTEKLKEALSLFVRPGGELWSLKDGQLCQRLDWTVEEAIAFVAGKMLEKGVRMAVIASGQFEDATGA